MHLPGALDQDSERPELRGHLLVSGRNVVLVQGDDVPVEETADFLSAFTLRSSGCPKVKSLNGEPNLESIIL